MILIRQPTDIDSRCQGGSLTIGNFDGVHRGHTALVERLVAQARSVKGPAVVLTFDPHPAQLLRPDRVPPPLMTLEQKANQLHQLGVDQVIAYPTDRAILALEPNDFFTQFVQQRLLAKAMVEGPNFCFGKERAGNINDLRRLCEEGNITLEVVDPVQLKEEVISSSSIRTLIGQGEVDQVTQRLGRPYQLQGKVTQGAGRGRTIGFPTANLESIETLMPAEGVYAATATTKEATWSAAVNIGPNPTFGEQALKVEVHLIDYEGTLYGESLSVNFLKRLREIRPFDSAEELIAQLKRDIEQTRSIAC